METKVCKGCGNEYPNTSEFFNLSEGRLKNKCKICTRQQYKAWLEKNKEIKYEKTAKWIKENEEYLREQRKLKYPKIKERSIKYNKDHYDKEKKKEYNKQYYETHLQKYRDKKIKWDMLNKEKKKEYKRKEYIKNKEKILLRTSIQHAINKGKSKTKDVITLDQWNEAKVYFNNCCAYCGKPTLKMSKEHYIPVSKGGIHNKTNILPICIKCNTSKKDSIFIEWYSKQVFYSEERFNKVQEYLNLMKSN